MLTKPLQRVSKQSGDLRASRQKQQHLRHVNKATVIYSGGLAEARPPAGGSQQCAASPLADSTLTLTHNCPACLFPPFDRFGRNVPVFLRAVTSAASERLTLFRAATRTKENKHYIMRNNAVKVGNSEKHRQLFSKATSQDDKTFCASLHLPL